MELLALQERTLDEAQQDIDLAAAHTVYHLGCCRCHEGPMVGKPKDGRHAPWEQDSCLERQVGGLAAGQAQPDGLAQWVVE
jgi:cytochrome c5